jgi:hypothetical protein
MQYIGRYYVPTLIISMVMVVPFGRLAYKEEQILRADLSLEYSKQVKIFGSLLV